MTAAGTDVQGAMMETDEPPPTADVAYALFAECSLCREDSSRKDPKLFPCLHNFCEECLASLKKSDTTDVYVCPACKQETKPDNVVSNVFLKDLIARSDENSASSRGPICQGCEENALANQFCADCSDWLCDQCVEAHRRVRVTKDHKIQPKEEVNITVDPKTKMELCPRHPNELLKYFCRSCDALTCRDCQLLEHQKHDFKMVGQASDKHKSWLVQMADRLQNDVLAMESDLDSIQKKIDDVNAQEQRESDKIKQWAIIFISEMNRRGRAMLDNVSALCHYRRLELKQQQEFMSKVLDSYRHTIHFTEEIIKNASNTSLLKTRTMMWQRISSLTKGEVKTMDPFDIVFGFDKQSVRRLMVSLGQLSYNGHRCTTEQINAIVGPRINATPTKIDRNGNSDTSARVATPPERANTSKTGGVTSPMTTTVSSSLSEIRGYAPYATLDKTVAENIPVARESDVNPANQAPRVEITHRTELIADDRATTFQSEPTQRPVAIQRFESEEDPNEDWCAVCNDGGDLLCCGNCPRVFHFKCHVPEIPPEPGDWDCGLCIPEVSIRVPSEPNRYTLVNGEKKRKIPVGLQPDEMKACERILLELLCHKLSQAFHHPVPRNTPRYYEIIKTPMDLGTIKSKVHPKHFNHYKTAQEFVADVQLVFDNCKKYNLPGSEIHAFGTKLETLFRDLTSRLLPYVDLNGGAGEAGDLVAPTNKRPCII